MPPVRTNTKRVRVTKYLDDDVPGSDEDIYLLPEIDPGKRQVIRAFGASMEFDGEVILEKRVSLGPTVWKAIRAIQGPKRDKEYTTIPEIENPISGPQAGVPRLRIRRVNREVTAKRIRAWIEGSVR